MAKHRTTAHRDERIRRQLFADSDGTVFDAKSKGFIPLPIVFRKLVRYLTATQLRVLLYLQLRASKEGLCFPTLDEIAFDIGVQTAKHVRPILRELERKGFIRTASKNGRMYFLVHDPSVPIRRLVHLRLMTVDDLREINGLREDLGHTPVEVEGGHP